jgi:hypothetical protein
MRVSFAYRKNMLPYLSLGIRISMPETITISTPLPVSGQILARTVNLSFFKYPTSRFSDGRIIPDFIGKIHINCYVSFFFKILIVVKLTVKALLQLSMQSCRHYKKHGIY